MTKFHLSYAGGRTPETEEEAAQVMQAWGAWFDDLGDAIADGGHPIGAVQTIDASGAVRDGGGVSGYTIILADDLSDAVNKAKGCPILTDGGSVEVGECLDM